MTIPAKGDSGNWNCWSAVRDAKGAGIGLALLPAPCNVAPKSPLTRWHPLRWAVLPLIYCIYALVRGRMTGTYPYPFIDVGILGPAQTALNVVGLTAGFVAGGYVLLGLAGRMRRRIRGA
jgi:hypothetical protein